MKAKYLIVTGNPVDGFNFIGPFENKDAAIEWQERTGLDPDWWVTPMEEPKERA